MNRILATRLGLLLLFSAAPLSAQSAPAARTAFNAVYLEAGGNGLIYSVNYERILPSNLALRAGLSYMSVSATSGSGSASANIVGIPLTFTYLAGGAGSLKFEVGGGASFMRFTGTSIGFGDDVQAGAFIPVGTLTAGLRIAPPKGGFTFKLGFTPFYHPDAGFVPWGGMSFGVAF